MVGAEAAAPYDRTHLSKAYLIGRLPRERLPLRAPEWYPAQRIELELGVAVTAIDLAAQRAQLSDGRRLRFDRLLLAVGGEPRTLPSVPDALTLRDIASADRLRAVLERAGELTIVGAGFIGCEVAAGARELGLEVTVLERLRHPLQRVLGDKLGEYLASVHRTHGVKLVTGVEEVPELRGPVLVATGSRPRDELGREAGLRVNEGVEVDATGQTSSDVAFAAGDCAHFYSPSLRASVHVEHFQTAERHGYATGRTMAGDIRPFSEVPWFWSDQYDLRLQYVGAGLPWNRVAIRGKLGEPPFTVFYLDGDRLVAAASLNDARTISHVRRLLELGVSPPVEVLADPARSLKALAHPQTAAEDRPGSGR
jgi:3-phenylpropionate/trans-cinnamate dioxygenase ferredoxin reductase subunit